MIAARDPTKTGECTYRAEGKDGVVAFLYHKGPVDVVEYNWLVQRTFLNTKYVERVRARGTRKDILSDVLRLTEAGKVYFAGGRNPVVWRVHLACSGKSRNGEEDPNCFPVCGSWWPCELDSCPHAHDQWHKCGARVELSATLEDVCKDR